MVGSETLRSRSLPPPPEVGTASRGVICARLRESLETMKHPPCKLLPAVGAGNRPPSPAMGLKTISRNPFP